jgi:DNA-binding GntR family transcriptional regulator
MQSSADTRLPLVTGDIPTRGARGHHFAAVYERLREAILLGELEPGAITTQMTLAEHFAVGRTPLREALRVLQSEGLVVNEPNRRVQVTSLTVSDAEQLHTARILLEPAAVRQTVPGFTSRDDAEMMGYLAQMDHYGQGRDWVGLRGTPSRFSRPAVRRGRRAHRRPHRRALRSRRGLPLEGHAQPRVLDAAAGGALRARRRGRRP